MCGLCRSRFWEASCGCHCFLWAVVGTAGTFVPFPQAAHDISEGNRWEFPVNTCAGNICPAHWIKGFFLMCCLTPVCWGTWVLCFPHDFPHLFLKLSFQHILLKLELWGRIGPCFPHLSQQLDHFLPWIIRNTLFFFLLFYLRVKAHLFPEATS